MPDGKGWAVETVTLSTHNGTHLDAPWHYHPTMNEGQRSWTIDEVPLEWCFQPGVKLDFRHFADGYVVTAADVEAELKRIGHELKPLEIVVVNTGAGAKYGQPDYVPSGCGMGAEATLYLLERGVRLTGTDALELGRALRPHREEVRRNARRLDSSGKATRPAATSAIAISKSCTTLKRCPRPASRCRASRSKSSAPRRAGPARSQFLTSEAKGRETRPHP